MHIRPIARGMRGRVGPPLFEFLHTAAQFAVLTLQPPDLLFQRFASLESPHEIYFAVRHADVAIAHMQVLCWPCSRVGLAHGARR